MLNGALLLKITTYNHIHRFLGNFSLAFTYLSKKNDES